MTISQGQADSFLLSDTEHASNAVMALVSDFPWNFNQFDAMVSLAFNIGSRAFRSSTPEARRHFPAPREAVSLRKSLTVGQHKNQAPHGPSTE
jgi:hypothetical protein